MPVDLAFRRVAVPRRPVSSSGEILGSGISHKQSAWIKVSWVNQKRALLSISMACSAM